MTYVHRVRVRYGEVDMQRVVEVKRILSGSGPRSNTV